MSCLQSEQKMKLRGGGAAMPAKNKGIKHKQITNHIKQQAKKT